jgi:signal transduction histidine kinase/CheY-like chemotaxis protein
MLNSPAVKDTSISPAPDIKKTSKRAAQFCCVAMMVATFNAIVNLIHGNIISAILIAGLVASLAIMVFINNAGNPRIAKLGLVVLLNVFLVLISFAEGLNTASTSYFLPLLYAIPFFVNNNKDFKLKVGVLFSITLCSFAVCVIFCNKTSTWQPISEGVYRQMFLINGFSSFMLCAVFAYLSIYLERRYADALLKQIGKTEEAMDARTKFLSSMGHELRTPLNGIIGASNLLRNSEVLQEQKEFLDILKYCSDHMLGLVNDILDFNKIEAGKLDLHPVKCNIKKLLKKSTLPFYNSFEEKKIELKVVVDDELDEVVLLDDLRLVQIINNLISNALKFTEKGYVKLEVTQRQKITGLTTITFCVEDTGIGIKEADQDRIFGSFSQVYNETTRKYGGTGLGLTICKRLLKMMDSILTVESKVGKGSKFSFTITVPVVECDKEKNFVREHESTDLEGIKILLAEDNIINMMIAKKFLEDKKAIVSTAENGQDALAILAKDDGFDIVLLDLEMPVMDGYTAVVEIQKNWPHIPVLAFTAALMDQEMLQKLLDLGFLDCILKPFEPLNFYSKVRDYAKPLTAESLVLA